MDVLAILLEEQSEDPARCGVTASFAAVGEPLPEADLVRIIGPKAVGSLLKSARQARLSALAALEHLASPAAWLRDLALAPVRRPAWAAFAVFMAALAGIALGRSTWIGGWSWSERAALGPVAGIFAAMAALRALEIHAIQFRVAAARQRQVAALRAERTDFTMRGVDGRRVKGESAGGAFFVAFLIAAARRGLVPPWSGWSRLFAGADRAVVSARIRQPGWLDGVEDEWPAKLAAAFSAVNLGLAGEPPSRPVLLLCASHDLHYLATALQSHVGHAVRLTDKRSRWRLARERGVLPVFADHVRGWAAERTPAEARIATLFRILLLTAFTLPLLAGYLPPPAPKSFAILSFTDLADEALRDPCLPEAVRLSMENDMQAVAALRVLSPQQVRLTARTRGVGELEAAAHLGVDEVVTGDCVESHGDGNTPPGTLSLSAHATNTRSRHVRPEVRVIGRVDDFFVTVAALSLAFLKDAGVSVTAAEEAAMRLNQMTLDNFCTGFLNLSRRRKLAAPPPAPQLPIPPAPTSLLLRAAFAADDAAEHQEVATRVAEYGRTYQAAYDTRDVDLLGQFYERFEDPVRSAVTEYFENAQDLTTTISDVDVRLVGGRAVVSFTRADRFTDRRSGLPQRMQSRLTRVFVKTPAGWQIAADQ